MSLPANFSFLKRAFLHEIRKPASLGSGKRNLPLSVLPARIGCCKQQTCASEDLRCVEMHHAQVCCLLPMRPAAPTDSGHSSGLPGDCCSFWFFSGKLAVIRGKAQDPPTLPKNTLLPLGLILEASGGPFSPPRIFQELPGFCILNGSSA